MMDHGRAAGTRRGRAQAQRLTKREAASPCHVKLTRGFRIDAAQARMVLRTALALVAVAHRQRSGLLPGKTAGRVRRYALASLIEERFETALREECGVRGGDVLIALVSGGSDSVSTRHMESLVLSSLYYLLGCDAICLARGARSMGTPVGGRSASL